MIINTIPKPEPTPPSVPEIFQYNITIPASEWTYSSSISMYEALYTNSNIGPDDVVIISPDTNLLDFNSNQELTGNYDCIGRGKVKALPITNGSSVVGGGLLLQCASVQYGPNTQATKYVIIVIKNS